MAIKPITGMLRRGLITDLSLAVGFGVTMATGFWYGYHAPRTAARDRYYEKLEQERAARAAAYA